MRTFTRLSVAATSLMTALALVIGGCSSDDGPADTGAQTGTVSGQVTEPASGLPVVGASVTLTPIAAKASQSTITDAAGDYAFTDVVAGSYTLTIDASGVTVDPTNPNLEYVGSSREIIVRGGESTIADSFLPIVDTSQAVDVTPGQPTVIEPESIPGLRIEIAADAATFPDGSKTGSINVVQVGFDQGPAPVPTGWAPTMMIRILPEGIVFDPPASIDFPNRDGLDAGGMDLYRYDGVAHDWTQDGRVTVAGEILTSGGGLLTRTSTHFIVCDATTVVGQVLDGQEAPVEGAGVSLWASVDPFGVERALVQLHDRSATTNATGDFTIADVRTCRVSVSALVDRSDAFGQMEPGEAIRTVADGTTDLGSRAMDVRTQTLFSLAGVVTDLEGNVMVEAQVQYFDPNDPNGETTQVSTNANGEYVFEALEGVPGREMGLWIYHSPTGYSREDRFVVPPLHDSGTHLTRNVTICDNQQQFSFCGNPGQWQLVNSSLLRITEVNVVCGETVTSTQDVTLVHLAGGDLTVQLESGQGSTVTAVFSRVSGDGPSGVSHTNLVGLYQADPQVAENPAFLVLHDDDTFSWVEASGVSPEVQYGVFSSTATELTVTFLYSNMEGPPMNTPVTMGYTRTGDTLVIDDPTGGGNPSVFGRCSDQGPQSGLDGEWYQDFGQGQGMALVLQHGEFAAVGRANVAKAGPTGLWR